MGDGHPAYIIAEIGINHNGDLEIAKQMIDAAVHAGVDAVKFQKRTPEVCTPPEQQKQMRETPWGYITYLEYRYKVEFDEAQYREIDRYCREKGIAWMVSVWDEPAVDFMEKFDTPAYKIPSASLTDHELLKHVRKTGKPLILSTGMSTLEQIQKGGRCHRRRKDLAIMHCTSTYPCEPEELNLKMVETLRAGIPENPDRLFGARGGPGALGGGGGAGRLHGGAPPYARPRHVGQRPGGLGGAGRVRAAGQIYPCDRSLAGRWREEGLRFGKGSMRSLRRVNGDE